MPVRDDLEEVAQRLFEQPVAGEWRGRREPALDDHALGVAELAVTRRAEDAVTLLPALEDLAIYGEGHLRGLAPPLPARQQDGDVAWGRGAAIELRHSPQHQR